MSFNDQYTKIPYVPPRKSSNQKAPSYLPSSSLLQSHPAFNRHNKSNNAKSNHHQQHDSNINKHNSHTNNHNPLNNHKNPHHSNRHPPSNNHTNPLSQDECAGEDDITEEISSRIWDYAYQMLLGQSFCDVTIVSQQGNVKVHSCILAFQSAYLNEVFTKLKCKVPTLILNLESIPLDTVRQMVCFFYSGQLKVTKFNLVDLLNVSEQYSFSSLQKACLTFFKFKLFYLPPIIIFNYNTPHPIKLFTSPTSHHHLYNIISPLNTTSHTSHQQHLTPTPAPNTIPHREVNVDNAIFLLSLTISMGLEDSQQSLLSFIVHSFQHVSQTLDFVYLPLDILECILLNDQLNIPCEIDVFKAVVKWISYKKDCRLEHATRLLNGAVRLELMSVEELADEVEAVDWLFDCQETKEVLSEAYRKKLLMASGLCAYEIRYRARQYIEYC